MTPALGVPAAVVPVVGRNRGDGLRPGDREQGIGRRHRAGLSNPVAVCVIENRGVGRRARWCRPRPARLRRSGRARQRPGTFDAAWTWSDYARQCRTSRGFAGVEMTASRKVKLMASGPSLFEKRAKVAPGAPVATKTGPDGPKTTGVWAEFHTFACSPKAVHRHIARPPAYCPGSIRRVPLIPQREVASSRAGAKL